MKEIEKTDLPEVGGGAWSDDGCIPVPNIDPIPNPLEPYTPKPDPHDYGL